jgi:hypothetical protein
LRREWSRKHDGSAAPGVSEDEELGWRHGEADFCGFAAMVDAGEDGDGFCAEDGFEAVEGFGDGVGAWVGDEAVGGGHLRAPWAECISRIRIFLLDSRVDAIKAGR